MVTITVVGKDIFIGRVLDEPDSEPAPLLLTAGEASDLAVLLPSAIKAAQDRSRRDPLTLSIDSRPPHAVYKDSEVKGGK